MLMTPERTANHESLRAEYARKADAYNCLIDEEILEATYARLMRLLARLRELEGYPDDYWMGLPRIDPPETVPDVPRPSH